MDDQIPSSLAGIELTPEGKIPVKEIDLVIDQGRADILLDSTRSSILRILKDGVTDVITSVSTDAESGDRIIRQKEVTRDVLSVVELVRISKDPDNDIESFSMSQAYHHLSKLIEHGFVVRYGTITTGKRTTDYYRRSARTFILERLPGDSSSSIEDRLKLARDQVKSYADRILNLFKFELSDKDYDTFIDLLTRKEEIELKSSMFAKVVTLLRSDIASNEELTILHEIMNLYSVKNDDWVNESRKIHDLLFSEI
ncbi:MAG: hypothetical protein ACFFEF_14940 [Candidatus Thorarchaeota archaeon]